MTIETNSPDAPTKQFVLGVDVGGTSIKAGVVEINSGELIQSCIVPTETARGLDHSLTQISKACQQLLNSTGLEKAVDNHIGLAVPELVDLNGNVRSSYSLKWSSSQTLQHFAPHRVPLIYSDVQAAAYGEASYGGGRDFPDFLYLSVGTGVSGSLVITGRPYKGAHGHAIAFASGLTSRDADSRWVPLESRVSGAGLAQRAGDFGIDACDGFAICALADAGDVNARTLVDDAASELALHAAILVNALDPNALIVGGGLGCAAGRYWTTFKSVLQQHLYRADTTLLPLVIEQAALGQFAGVLGAARYASLKYSDVRH